MYPQCLTIDFHSHVLPGMDDGSQNSDMSVEMLRRMGQQGIHIVAATPHFYGYREGVDSFLQRRAARWERLNQKWKDNLPRVVLGAEVACFSGVLELDGLERLCYQGTNTLLLELPFAQWTETELDIVSTLCLDRGYRVILAHFERYIGVQKNKYIAARLQELPVWIQINAGALLPWTRRGKCINMFLENRAHLLGSDSHNLTDRRPNLDLAREMLNEMARLAVTWLPEMMESNEPNISEEAIMPEKKAAPSYTKNTVIGAMVCAVLCYGFFVVRYLMDDSIRTSDELEKYFGLAPLTSIPEEKLDARKNRGKLTEGKREVKE